MNTGCMTNVVFLVPTISQYLPSFRLQAFSVEAYGRTGKESSRMMGAGRWQVLIMIKFKLSCPAYDTV